MTLSICCGVRAGRLNAGMIGENARARPPCVMTARHWTSDSGVDGGAVAEIRKRRRRFKARQRLRLPLCRRGRGTRRSPLS